ncbi:MAG: gliding motility-associated C-terminal domain-containing protein [Bacteroidetes bacterium]|nr:gliding motility-associated C-terminal domain-containing protein [Bacteroidota bacterium]
MSKIKNIFFLLFVCSNIIVSAQINCSINIAADTLQICEGDSIQIQATGTQYNLNWSQKMGLSDSSIAKPIAFPKKTTKYYVTNRYLYPTENIINGDFESGNTAFTSQYVQKCVNGRMDWGAYCINPYTDIFWQGWGACPDHTSGTGNLMVMDAAVTPNVGIWCETVAVNKNTDYQFTTWVTPVTQENPPLLQFSINNVPLAQPFNVPDQVCKWNEFYALWNSGNATSADICILNQDTISMGNDFALDDISFKSVCVSEDSVVIVVHPNVSVNLGPDENICNGDSTLLNTKLPSSYQFNWSNGASTNKTYVTAAGTYYVTVDNGFGCTATDSIKLISLGDPVSTLENDTTLCFSFAPALLLHSGNALNHSWSTGAKTSDISVSAANTYYVTLSNGINCSVTDSIHVLDFCYPTFFYLPNSFSPNGDGLNDVFSIKGESIYVLKLSIFNRWGELIFETSDPSATWNGVGKNGAAPMDVYVVHFEYEGLSPNTDKKQKIQRYTHLNLIR